MLAQSLRALARSRCFVALAAAFAAFCAIQWVLLAWYPLFLSERFSLSMTASGWNATLFVQVCQVTGILGGGWLADRWRRRWAPARLAVAATGVLLSAPFAWLTFSASTLNEARAWSAAFGLFSGLLAGTAFSAAYDVTGSGNRGLSGAVLNTAGGLASAAMVYLAGVWRETAGFATVVGWMVPFSVITSITVVLVARRRFQHDSAVSP